MYHRFFEKNGTIGKTGKGGDYGGAVEQDPD